jgi:hypothetical protein
MNLYQLTGLSLADIDEWLPGDGALFIHSRIYRDDGSFDVYSNVDFNEEALIENGKRFTADNDVQYIKTVIPIPDDDSDVEEIDAEHPDFKRMELMRSITPIMDFESTICDDEEADVIDAELTDLPEQVKFQKQTERAKKKHKEKHKFFS